MNKKLIIALAVLSSLPIKTKFINLFKKEQVIVTFQQEDKQAKNIQDKIDKSLSNNNHGSSFQKKQFIKTEQGLDISTKEISVYPTEVAIIDPQINTNIPEIFDKFSDLLKTVKEHILEQERIKFFFYEHSTFLFLKISELQNKSSINKKDKEKLSILICYCICVEYDKNTSNLDSIIKKIKNLIPEPFSYLYFEKVLQSQIKMIKKNKSLKAICSNQNILLLQKQLKSVKKWLHKNQNYSYEKKMAEKQTDFSTKFLPYRYNQLPFIDRTTLKYFNTESGKPQHEIHHITTYAKE